MRIIEVTFTNNKYGVGSGYALGKMHLPKTEVIIMAFMTFSFIPGIAIYITLYKMMAQLHLMQSYFALILPYTVWHITFSMYIFKNFFETVPMDLIEPARLDGCGELKAFNHIVLTLVKPAIASVIVFTDISCWRELMWAQIVTAALRNMITFTIGLLISRRRRERNGGCIQSASLW